MAVGIRWKAIIVFIDVSGKRQECKSHHKWIQQASSERKYAWELEKVWNIKLKVVPITTGAFKWIRDSRNYLFRLQ